MIGFCSSIKSFRTCFLCKKLMKKNRFGTMFRNSHFFVKIVDFGFWELPWFFFFFLTFFLILKIVLILLFSFFLNFPFRKLPRFSEFKKKPIRWFKVNGSHNILNHQFSSTTIINQGFFSYIYIYFWVQLFFFVLNGKWKLWLPPRNKHQFPFNNQG